MKDDDREDAGFFGCVLFYCAGCMHQSVCLPRRAYMHDE
jgi:hypothetical protein